MQNSDMPAMPTSPNDNDPQWASARTGGLTKREHFAGLAMQGFCTAVIAEDMLDETLANFAVRAADALLKELDKTQNAKT